MSKQIRHLWHGCTDYSARILWDTQKGGINLWMLVSILALSGWLIDSLFVGLRMHSFLEAGFRVHLGHLWYGPPLIIAGLLLVRRYRPEWMPSMATLPGFDNMARTLRPEVKALARHIIRSKTQASLIAFLQQYPSMALTTSDLAGQIGGHLDDVALALRELATLGLVEAQYVCGMTFYRLTTDEARRCELRELVTWQEGWFEHAEQVAHSVGPRLARPGSRR